MTKQKKNSRWQGYDPRYIYSLVVRRYFADMKTKIEIAEELGVSRFKVARLIDEAIEQEYVRFIFPKQQAMDEEIANNLRKKFHLEDAIVLSVAESWTTQEETQSQIG